MSSSTCVVFIPHALLQLEVGVHARKQQRAAVLWNIMHARTSEQTYIQSQKLTYKAPSESEAKKCTACCSGSS